MKDNTPTNIMLQIGKEVCLRAATADAVTRPDTRSEFRLLSDTASLGLSAFLPSLRGKYQKRTSLFIKVMDDTPTGLLSQGLQYLRFGRLSRLNDFFFEA